MAAENTAPTADQNEAGEQTHYGLWAVFRRDPHPAESVAVVMRVRHSVSIGVTGTRNWSRLIAQLIDPLLQIC